MNWTTEKPELTEPCILLVADHWVEHDEVTYEIYQYYTNESVIDELNHVHLMSEVGNKNCQYMVLPLPKKQ